MTGVKAVGVCPDKGMEGGAGQQTDARYVRFPIFFYLSMPKICSIVETTKWL